MAVLANDTKAGFYPTDPETIKKIIDRAIAFKENRVTYALDCCCGDGEAIEFIGKEYGCTTYAVELEEQRAKKASKRAIKTVLNADALGGVRKSNRWVGLNFLNPPYITSADNTRMEIDFVERWGITTVFGGVLILVINPSSANEKMAQTLRKQGYKPRYSFFDPTNEDYIKYGQFLMVFEQRMDTFRAPIESFYNLFENQVDVNSYIDIEKIEIRTGAEPSIFKEIVIPRWKVDESLLKSNLKKNYFDELRKANFSNRSIEHPNEGQSAILIASGALNDAITLANGDKIILKGTSSKIEKATSIINADLSADKAKVTEHYVTVVYGLNLTNGQFAKYN